MILLQSQHSDFINLVSATAESYYEGELKSFERMSDLLAFFADHLDSIKLIIREVESDEEIKGTREVHGVTFIELRGVEDIDRLFDELEEIGKSLNEEKLDAVDEELLKKISLKEFPLAKRMQLQIYQKMSSGSIYPVNIEASQNVSVMNASELSFYVKRDVYATKLKGQLKSLISLATEDFSFDSFQAHHGETFNVAVDLVSSVTEDTDLARKTIVLMEKSLERVATRENAEGILKRLLRFDEGELIPLVTASIVAQLISSNFENISEKMKQKINLAILFQNIGLERKAEMVALEYDKDILASDSGPEKDLRAILHYHPNRSAEFLSKNPVFDFDILKCIERHHEFPDGSGYPSGLLEQQMTMMELIVVFASRVGHILAFYRDIDRKRFV